MIRIIKTLALTLMLVAVNAQAEEKPSVMNQIKSQAGDTFGYVVNTLTAPVLSYQDIQCLARNIYYEAGSEPEEGKVAVGLVTINRANTPNYPSTICGVVKQKTLVTVPKKVATTTMVKPSWIEPPKAVTEVQTTWVQKAVCQFSWNCMSVPKIKEDDPRWQESQRVALELADGGYEQYREKYANALHFHAKHVKPGWKLKRVNSVGGHIFYE
ncbi:Cell wall hydrolase, SleB [uncultured Caudovirales phage]|uniref:Cell wall hydrolase, SleB n=1 Tax=uncultured Caudovirales phage TaxID=2100421 RepID=A0A6J7WD76_9CAUD|nr:Cell wall hydrolase, SleB [uncultured Caudovirales phage]CAB5208662.1 Cell wall hydrolase, SleB [uncultured Caudovirales phage]